MGWRQVKNARRVGCTRLASYNPFTVWLTYMTYCTTRFSSPAAPASSCRGHFRRRFSATGHRPPRIASESNGRLVRADRTDAQGGLGLGLLRSVAPFLCNTKFVFALQYTLGSPRVRGGVRPAFGSGCKVLFNFCYKLQYKNYLEHGKRLR